MIDNSPSMAPKQARAARALRRARQSQSRQLATSGAAGVVPHRRRRLRPRRRPAQRSTTGSATPTATAAGCGPASRRRPTCRPTAPAGRSRTAVLHRLRLGRPAPATPARSASATRSTASASVGAGRLRLRGAARVGLSRAARRRRSTPASCATTRSSWSSSSPTRTTARRRPTRPLRSVRRPASAKWGVLHSFRCTQCGVALRRSIRSTAAAPSRPPTASRSAGGPLFDVSRYQALFAETAASRPTPPTSCCVNRRAADAVRLRRDTTPCAGPDRTRRRARCSTTRAVADEPTRSSATPPCASHAVVRLAVRTRIERARSATATTRRQ